MRAKPRRFGQRDTSPPVAQFGKTVGALPKPSVKRGAFVVAKPSPFSPRWWVGGIRKLKLGSRNDPILTNIAVFCYATLVFALDPARETYRGEEEEVIAK